MEIPNWIKSTLTCLSAVGVNQICAPLKCVHQEQGKYIQNVNKRHFNCVLFVNNSITSIFHALVHVSQTMRKLRVGNLCGVLSSCHLKQKGQEVTDSQWMNFSKLSKVLRSFVHGCAKQTHLWEVWGSHLSRIHSRTKWNLAENSPTRRSEIHFLYPKQLSGKSAFTFFRDEDYFCSPRVSNKTAHTSVNGKKEEGKQPKSQCVQRVECFNNARLICTGRMSYPLSPCRASPVWSGTSSFRDSWLSV